MIALIFYRLAYLIARLPNVTN